MSIQAAHKYGYSLKTIARLTREGYTYEFGVFIKRERIRQPVQAHRVTIAFLYEPHDQPALIPTVRRTFAIAETPQKALRRAYRYRRWINNYGSLTRGMMMGQSLTPSRAPAQDIDALAYFRQGNKIPRLSRIRLDDGTEVEVDRHNGFTVTYWNEQAWDWGKVDLQHQSVTITRLSTTVA